MEEQDFQALDLVPDATLITNSAGIIEFANAEAERLFIYPRAELLGQSIEMLMPERYRSDHIAQRGRFMANPSARPMGTGLKLTGRRKDGAELTVDIHLAPFNTDEGVKVVAAIRDVSEARREREGLEALHEVAVSSSGLLDPSTLGHLVVERARSLLRGDDATLLWWDPVKRSLRVLADTFSRPFPRDVAIGEGTAGIAFQSGQQVIVEDYPNWEHAVPDAIARGMTSVLAVPLVVRDQAVGALTLSFTTSRQFSKEDLRLVTLLAAQIAPALESARLHETVLQMSSELQEASEVKSRFLASMSHELRTPLTAIIGFSELLIDEPQHGYEPDRRNQFLEQILKSGQHLLALINDILDLSKVEAGQMELRLSTFDLGASVDSAIDTVRPLAERKHLIVHADPEASVSLFADEGKIKQMLLNLLSNAIKFTSEGGQVTVSIEQLEDEVMVNVADTGIGIAADDQSRLFVEFQQLDSGPGRNQQGTGLGLALTKRLAELHGGRVGVESQLGSGSRFFFVVPRRTSTLVPPEIIPDSEPRGPLIMVVEDQESAATLLSFTLRRAGYRVEVVRSGHKVLEKAIQLRPRAITLDILLPDPDGWDILRTLKERSETRDIPVLVISVLDDCSLGFALGADDYLVKPVARESLLTFMTNHVPTNTAGDGKIKVLAVDDDPVALQLLVESLGPQFQVLTAGDGPGGITLARSERPDAMILDLVMPGMSGFEVAAALKADSATRDIPILILTAKNVSEEDKARLNGHVSSVMHKGKAGTSGLLRWLQSVRPRRATEAEVPSRTTPHL